MKKFLICTMAMIVAVLGEAMPGYAATPQTILQLFSGHSCGALQANDLVHINRGNSSENPCIAAVGSYLGGALGSSDNRLMRVDGTGGATAQASAVTVDDSGNMSGVGTISSGVVTASGFVGPVTGNASTATALATARAIYGNNFDGTTALTQIIASTYGGTGNGFTKFSGPSSSEKTFTLPNANAALLTDNTPVTVAQGGTGTGSAGIAAFNNITGYSASGATGTTSANLVFSASPTLTGTVNGAAAIWSGLETAAGFSPTDSTSTGNRFYLAAANTPAISANGISVMRFGTVASGVNYWSPTPGATGFGPALTAAGTDTDIDAILTPKGIGQGKINGSKAWAANIDATLFPNLRGCIANWTSHASGAGQNCIGLWIGTSLTANALSGGQDAPTQDVSSQIAGMLNNAGIPASANSWIGGWNSSYPRTTYDKRLIKGADWALNGSLTSAGGNPYTATSGGSAPLAFTPGWVDSAGTLHKIAYDTCKILYVQFPTTSSFKWDFDGGSATTINANTTNGLGIATVTTTLGEHTLNINWVSGTATIIGSFCYNSAIPQVIALNAGWPGSTAADWLVTNETGSNDPWAPGNFVASLDPLFVNIELGANEELSAASTSTYGTNLATVVGQAQNSGATDVILESYNWFNPGIGTSHLPYVQKIREVAGTTVPYIGISEAFVSYAAETATNTSYINTSDGFTGVHLNPAGQRARAEIWKSALAPAWNFGGGNPAFGDNTGNKSVLGKFSIGTSKPTDGAALDLGSNTDKNNSSILLPGGTAANRPTTGVAGMARYNSSTPGIEAYFSSAWNTLLSAAGTGLSKSGVTVSSNAVEHIGWDVVLAATPSTTKYGFTKISAASTLDNFICSANSITGCSPNPTFTVYGCGSSTTCASPTTLASVQVTSTGTAFPATLSNTAVSAGDYITFATSAGGSCSLVIAHCTAQFHQN